MVEIIRVIVVTILVFFLMFFVQPDFLTQQVTDYTPEDFIQQYTLIAWIIFIASTIATLGWYGVAVYYNNHNNDLNTFKNVWAGFSLLPIISIFASPLLLKSIPPIVIIFLVGDALLLFWFATAIATPGRFKYSVVPGSNFLRHLPCIK